MNIHKHKLTIAWTMKQQHYCNDFIVFIIVDYCVHYFGYGGSGCGCGDYIRTGRICWIGHKNAEECVRVMLAVVAIIFAPVG